MNSRNLTPRVCLAQIMHETNTFSHLVTDLEAFRCRELYVGRDAIQAMTGAKSEFAAFHSAGTEYGWNMVPALVAEATPSGPVTADAWRALCGILIDTLNQEGPWDAVLLALHGAMVAEAEPDADGALLEAVRAIVGPAVPVVATLDLHANVSDRMAENANALVAYRTYPHVDQSERGFQAAALVRDMLAEGSLFEVELLRLPLLDGCDQGRDSGPVMPDLLEKADGLVGGPLRAISIQAGFPWADVWEAGPSVAISHAGEPERAQSAAKILGHEIWRRRNETSMRSVSPEIAVAEARRCIASGGRAVLADGTDNPGGGAYGDATALLSALLSASCGRIVFGSIWDPAAVTDGLRAGEGATLRVFLGGHSDPNRGGSPLNVEGTVILLRDAEFICDGPMMAGKRLSLGPSMVVRIGETDVIVTSNRLQVTDLNFFRCMDVEPTDYDVIALKSLQHFRAAFASLAQLMVVVDSGGLVTFDLASLPYANVRRPIWPLERRDIAFP